MKSLFKPLVISFLGCLLPNSASIQACGGGFDHEYYAYQSWLFQIDLIPMKTLHLLSYPRLNYAEKHADPFGRFQTDTSFYLQNLAEWQLAIAADPAIKSKVADKDIHEILYNIAPEPFFRKIKKDSLRQNTFIKAVQSSKPLLNYLHFAKTCEQLMNLGGAWEEDAVKKKNSYSLKEHIQIGDAMLNQNSISVFVKERVAYQIVKMAHYLGDTARVMATYKQFLENSPTKSWVIGSARYYDAVAHENPALKNLLLSRTFEHSIDKRWLSLEHFDYSESLRPKSLALAETVEDKARLMLMPVLLNDGRTLNDLKQIYQTHPQNYLLQIAIQREINKLENWILTNRFTAYHPSEANSESQTSTYERQGREEEIINARNLRSDMAYLDDVAAFVNKIETENQQFQPDYWAMAVAHLAFLKKDFAKAKQYLAKIQDGQNNSIAMQTQKAVTLLLCDLYASWRLNPEIEQAILKLDAFLKKNATQITDYEAFRSQIMRFLSERFMADGQKAKGLLILSKSSLTYGSIAYAEKNFYHSFLENNEPHVIGTAIDLLSGKTAQTDFDKWLLSEPKPYDYERNRSTDTEVERKAAESPKWDIAKLKDYQSILYIHRDQLDSAYSVLKTLPETNWNRYPYSTYMIFNPFHYMPNVPNSRWEDTLSDPVYAKTAFLEKLIELKHQLIENPKKYEQNYFLIGTAYYNMTQDGNFWLMSHIHNGGNDLFHKDSTFEAIHWGCKRAQEWFEKGAKLCETKSNAVLCGFMAQQCQNKRIELGRFETQQKTLAFANAPIWRVLRQRFKGMEQYEKREYWCQHLDELLHAIDGGEINTLQSPNKQNNYWYLGLLGLGGLGGYAFYRRRQQMLR
jgi:hypothetical protein